MSKAIRTVKGWAELPTNVKSQRQRKDVLRNWVLGNGLLSDMPDTHLFSQEETARVWASVYDAAERGISALRTEDIDMAESINAMIDSMRKRKLSETTIFGHRFKVVNLFRYVKIGVDSDDLNTAVKKVSAARVTDDRQPSPDQLKQCLIVGTPKEKVAVSFSVSTGARIGESCRVKLSDIFWKENPVRVEFPARITKTAQKRYSFLSSECVQLVKTYLVDRENRGIKSAWLFDGEIDGHLSSSMMGVLIRNCFIKAGMITEKPKSERPGAQTGAHDPYHPHVLRATNLGLTKATGYPDSYAEYLVGKSTGSKENYIGPEKTASLWLEKVETVMNFLGTKTQAEVTLEITELRKKVSELEKGIEIDKQIVETQIVGPPKSKFETRKIESTDELALERALSEGFEPVPGTTVNGHIFLRRKTA
ncbi:MAG TPA: site-specific integrase [Candidatus Bathyarchaeia archaeon]|nr:site-specific integrase [Candidatus Bathyarchaeia archaeon]